MVASMRAPETTVRVTGPDRARIVPVLSVLLGIVAFSAGLWTFWDHGLLTGPAVSNGSARGTGLVVAIAGLLILAAVMMRGRHAVTAGFAWLGALAYLAYNSVLLLFGTPFNRAFLLYVAVLGLSLWTAAVALPAIDHEAIRSRFSARTPARGVAIYIWVVAALNALVWLRAIVPALGSARPSQLLDGAGMTTNPIYVQDLVFWLPLAMVVATALWQRRAWAYLVVGGLLVFWVIEAIGVATDQWFGHRADPASTVASAAAVPGFAVLAVAGLVVLFAYVRSIGPDPSDATGTTR
jgi:hypothetical protein